MGGLLSIGGLLSSSRLSWIVVELSTVLDSCRALGRISALGRRPREATELTGGHGGAAGGHGRSELRIRLPMVGTVQGDTAFSQCSLGTSPTLVNVRGVRT